MKTDKREKYSKAPLSPPSSLISDDELVTISVRDLNRQLKMRGPQQGGDGENETAQAHTEKQRIRGQVRKGVRRIMTNESYTCDCMDSRTALL
ncbi:hypothetical protein FJT64_023675 [Amphibalanus amphitrite]|uniref:Uncharacterized protein n=1 Tax=Amphibalanus amphitrite TaxID=1232801 RepID=A0A6A4WQW1_AMPAM|nr:hypothetical protein FJT64_023675 [Amphibalanus amphitrite]